MSKFKCTNIIQYLHSDTKNSYNIMIQGAEEKRLTKYSLIFLMAGTKQLCPLKNYCLSSNFSSTYV